MQTHTLPRARSLVVFFFVSAMVGAGARSAAAQVTLPPGFSESLIAPVTDPTAMQFAPDGRLFVCEQGGTLRVIKDGVMLPTPFVTLSVSSVGERGLLGVAFDPNFAVNQYVYVYYTATTPTLRNRVSRFTATGDVAASGSEVVIFELPAITTIATNHNGGALNFGPDGRLYIAVGEHNVPSNSQSLGTTLGKMLRINSDGSIPADNPFFGVATGQNRAIWALGLRNPFTFAFDPSSGRMFINDVGELTWEEINEGAAGANYGWPIFEGPTTNPSFASPTYAYSHSEGCAITGGAFYPTAPSQFPSAYSGVYFFTDICGFWIKMLNPAAGNAVTTFATGIWYPVALAVSPGGELYYLDRNFGGVHRISYAVSADSVTPASGSGSAQTFTMRYSSVSGAANLSSVFGFFTAASGGSCLVRYDVATNTLGLLNDAGTQYLSGTPGVSGGVTNSRCAIAFGSASAVLNGTVMTLTVPMTFGAGFAGTKNVHLHAANTSGIETGWPILGTWTVPGAPPATVTADSIMPASGSSASQTFVLQASDTTGATNLRTMFVWFNAGSASSSPTSSCLVYYDRASNLVGLLNDAGNQYLTGMAGASGTVSNSQCAIMLGGITVSASGNTLTLNLPMTFTPAFAGAKTVYLYASNAAGATSGWPVRGTWTVPAAPPATVTADSVVPASGSGASQTFALQASDTTGAANLRTMFIWFNAGSASSSPTSSCLVYYDRASNLVGLLNDAGNQYLTGMAGASGTVSNSQCAIMLGGITVSASGNTLTLNLPMTFTPAFAGAKNVHLYAANAAGVSSGWPIRGTWTVPAAPPATVTADSVMPASGSSASQTFALQASDTTGATNLRTMFVWFTASASNPANSCLVYYDRPSNVLGLLNDAANGYMTGMAGAAGTLSNSQCAVMLGGTTVSASGTTLTLTVPMTFTPAFAGVKNVHLYAANAGGVTSGWPIRGTWTVP